MLTIEIDNKDGNMWSLSGVAFDVSYKTSRVGKASVLELSFLWNGFYQASGFKYNCGDIIRVHKDSTPVFYGYIFGIEDGRDEAVKIVAFDQLRYLLAKDGYLFKDQTLGDIIRKIANDTGLKLGTIADTNHKILKKLEDGSTYLDMIYNAMNSTTVATGRTYVFYDKYGELTLRDIVDLRLQVSIGDDSLLYDYESKRSIDSDTYNRIKLVQDNKSTGKREVYIAQDSSNIAKWGRLQYFQKVDEKYNKAQITQAMNNLILLKNREKRSFKIDAIGDIRVRAGVLLHVKIEEAGVNDFYLVNECDHKFNGVDHTMTLDLQVYG